MTGTNGIEGKIASPAKHLVKEVQQLDEALDKVASLQEELVNERTENQKLAKQVELSLSDKERADLHFKLQKDERIVAITDRLDSTRHQLDLSMNECTGLRERARLLNEEIRNTKDKFELDAEWKRLVADVEVKSEELDELRKLSAIKKIERTEEVADLDSIRAKYNSELVVLRQIWGLKRENVAEYNAMRSKFVNIPPLSSQLSADPEQAEAPVKKRTLFQKLFRRKL